MRSLLLLVLFAAPALSQTAEPRPRESAEQFTLDLPPPEADASDATTPRDAQTVDAPEDAAVSAGTSGAEAKAPRFSVDTPVETLIANRRSKAVLDRGMPGLSSDKNLPKFSKLSLRQLAPLSGGRLTPELLEKVGAELSAID